ncbi:accessory Sec system protein Asp1 [Pseudobutyrivibrio xylanivorans]|uniref:Accessory Sec system protein Asp1 n=1 Tax=Pseudobutyrivibrio xylanivorans TaxID=185007 RepID=A0A5P6VRA7_PSEXY|nr:accessory Sec system protein Asp1 [Pseudobutyrivibrio xylanivorans]QFJ55225.1 accessory Sec system protein Asp1 [Pseudobutyrivibrio xylanivorans]
MLYFIPAWYQQNKWKELEQNWHTRRMHTEFDDTVKQVQMFHRSGMRDFKILLLSHTPNFRHFLHRQGVIHANYWSCFDAIQEVRRKKPVVFSFHNFDWPQGIEFIYTPFVVVAYLDNKKYAQIEFGEAGNPIEVAMYKDGLVSRKNIYDDRGFVSAMEVYSEGHIIYTDYLTELGVVKMREYADDGRVDINPNANNFLIFDGNEVETATFNSLHYRNILEVIREVFYSHILTNDKADDTFCIAMHQKNVFVANELVGRKKCILSFYEDRYRLKNYPEAFHLVKHASYIVTDSEATSRYLMREFGDAIENIIDISPYDSRMDFGISSELMVQKILVPVDHLPDERFNALIKQLATYIQTNENAMVHLFTRNADYDLPERLLNRVADIVEQIGYDRRIVIPEDVEDSTAENEIEGEDKEEIPVRFFVEQCVDELSVSRCIREQRIMVDMSHNPDLYLQINCISAAIPQIVRRETHYMKNMYNGFVVREFEQIPAALDYFLGSLANWNQAKVYSYDIAQNFTTKKLLEKWKIVQEYME